MTNSDGTSTTAYSLHGSPLNAPFPFANSAPWAFLKQDQYTFATADNTDKYTAEVNTQFPSVGNGFLRIEVASERPSKILVEFVGDQDSESADLILSRELAQLA
ncbi:MAG: hypothetical protein ACJA0Z_004468 [Halioglobus sp.]